MMIETSVPSRAQRLAHLQAALARQHQVEQHEVAPDARAPTPPPRRRGAGPRPRSPPARGSRAAARRASPRPRRPGCVQPCRFGPRDRTARARCAGRPAGSRAPASVPPCASTMARAMASPRPEPPLARLREPSTRNSRSVRRGRSSAGTPGALSSQSRCTRSPSLRAYTCEPPGRIRVAQAVLQQVAEHLRQPVGVAERSSRRSARLAARRAGPVSCERAALRLQRVGDRSRRAPRGSLW